MTKNLNVEYHRLLSNMGKVKLLKINKKFKTSSLKWQNQKLKLSMTAIDEAFFDTEVYIMWSILTI